MGVHDVRVPSGMEVVFEVPNACLEICARLASS